ncbi:hypothetical protein ABIC27_005129 [Streptomyces sp. PvR034]
MKIRMPGRGLVRTAALLAMVLPAAAGLLGGAVAEAAPVGNSTFMWSGDPGEGGDDQARWYASTDGDVFGATASADHGSISVTINRPGDPWTLDLAAPAGQELAVGDYADAVRFPETGPRPAVPSVFANGYRGGCATLTGGFGIKKLEWGPGRTVKELQVYYNQDCDDRNVLHGELNITATPVPPRLALSLTIAADGKVASSTGRATLHGTVTCSKPVRFSVTGTSVQQLQHTTTNGIVYSPEIACVPGRSMPWTGESRDLNGVAFVKGKLSVDAVIRAYDPDGSRVVEAKQTKLVTLTKS